MVPFAADGDDTDEGEGDVTVVTVVDGVVTLIGVIRTPPCLDESALDTALPLTPRFVMTGEEIAERTCAFARWSSDTQGQEGRRRQKKKED